MPVAKALSTVCRLVFETRKLPRLAHQALVATSSTLRAQISAVDPAGGYCTQLLDKALEDRQALMVSAVLTELLSEPKLPSGVAGTLSEVPLIEIALRHVAELAA